MTRANDPAELIRRAHAAGVPVFWVERGRVTDPEAHGFRAPLGAPEWQFSDGPAGGRSTSADFLGLAEGMAALGPAVYILTPETAEGLETAPTAPEAATWADLTPETAEGPGRADLTPEAERIKARLESFGFQIGARDPRVNTDFPGAFMVAESYGESELPTRDGANGPWAVVGDDLGALLAEAESFWADLTPETAEGPQRAPAGLTAEGFTAPEFWAPGLVNGDWGGTDPAERKAAEAWAATLPGPIVSAEAAGFLWRHEAFAFWPFGACAATYSVLIQHKETQK